MQNRPLRTAFLATILFLSPVLFAQTKQQEHPNVVYILVDELGYFEPAFMGGLNIETPNLDRMAAEGIVFKNHFGGSCVCAPTRCCLLTGKHSGHTSVRGNSGGSALRAEESTIASILKPLGYATGGYGKWGCGGRDSTGVPEKHGFDEFYGYYDQVHAHTYFPPYLIRNSEEVLLDGNHGNRNGKTYSQYEIHDAALEFIKENQAKPFFAYLPYTPPHGMFDIPDNDPAWEIYKEKPWPDDARRYAAMTTMVDRQVGEILDLLKQLNLEEKTLVFFSGDNGGQDYFKTPGFPRGVHSANKHPKTGLEYRGTKRTLYEGGLRIPFIARWPGKIPAGSVSEHLSYFPDIMPTISEVTGATLPNDSDGISILPTMLGEELTGREQAKHEYLYWEFNGVSAVRNGNWRAVRPKLNADWELYDLKVDPSESNNVALLNPVTLSQLKTMASSAHEPVREGTYTSTKRHERDRRAKHGKHDDKE